MSDLGIDENFFDLGGHSLLLIKVHALLCRELNQDLSVVDVFSNPTIRKLAAGDSAGWNNMRRLSRLTAVVARAPKSEDIAIIGMSGRFPGAESVAEFWRNLLGNVESIVEFSDDELRQQGLDPDAMRAAGHYVQRRGQLVAPGPVRRRVLRHVADGSDAQPIRSSGCSSKLRGRRSKMRGTRRRA